MSCCARHRRAVRIGSLVGCALLASVTLLAAEAREAPPATTRAATVRFAAVDVFADSGAESLAAYQIEMKAKRDNVAIVGIEGGEHAAFREPPYYDPAAMRHDRVILAAFNTGPDLPRGRTRVARVHMQITGDTEPEFELKPVAAATTDGREIRMDVSVAK